MKSHPDAGYYSDLDRLKKEYTQLAEKGRFVRNSDWRAICRHETGHVVANIYGIDPLQLAFDITHISKRIELFEFLKEELSLYSTSYEDGREIISECFSAYYGKIDIAFAKDFALRCKSLSKRTGECDESMG